MEARQTFTANSVPKGLVIVVAACAAVALATLGVAATKGFGASSGAAVPAKAYPVPGTVLRQDNPVVGATLIDRGADRGQISASAGSNVGRTAGNQVQDPSAAGGDDYGSSADLTRQLPVQGQSGGFEPSKGYRAN